MMDVLSVLNITNMTELINKMISLTGYIFVLVTVLLFSDGIATMRNNYFGTTNLKYEIESRHIPYKIILLAILYAVINIY